MGGTSNCSVFFDSPISDGERRERLYQGDIFVLSPTDGTRELIDFAQEMLLKAFAPIDPRDLHRHKTPEEVAAALSDLKPKFIHHPECKRIIPAILKQACADLDKTYFDVPRLRTAYPSDFLSSGIAYAFHPHRDTWYSAPPCQLNWWLPIYPLHSDNAMGFYPRYFKQGLANSSENYNYYEWNKKSRAAAAQHVRRDTREQPKATQEIDCVTVRLLPPPGGVIIFSGAQLHETVENTSGAARYSIDFRTVHFDDVVAQRGAANVDSKCTGTTLRDFMRGRDLAHLPDEAIAPYDDGSEAKADILYFGDRLVDRRRAAKNIG